MKKFFWSLLFVVLILSLHTKGTALSATKKWEKAIVDRVIDNQHFLLKDERIIRLIGIESPQVFSHPKTKRCYSRETRQRLRFLLTDKEVSLFFLPKKHPSDPFPARLILQGAELPHFLLQEGMARYQEDDRLPQAWQQKARQLEAQAQQEQKGLWSGCGVTKNRLYLKQHYGISARAFQRQFGTYNAPLSVGRVTKILRGNLLKLENGLQVKLLGLEVPPPEDKDPAHACFGKQSKAFLEELLLGRNVFLRKDITHLTENRELLRYVFLPPRNKNEPEIFVNKILVQKGYAKSSWPSHDEYFKKEFEMEQERVYQNPVGAWKACLPYALTL